MLMLHRKAGESIVLPGLGVVLTVVRVKGNGVRLGITAPPGVSILREEIWERSWAVDLPAGEGRPPVRGAARTAVSRVSGPQDTS
jgi:carbon storage regulator